MFGQVRKYFDRAQMRQLNAYVGRMGLLLDGLQNQCTTVLYFGIEDVQAKYTPKHDCEVGAQAIGCDLATLRLLRAMLDKGRSLPVCRRGGFRPRLPGLADLAVRKSAGFSCRGCDVMRPEAHHRAAAALKKAGVCVLFAEKLPHIDALSGQQLQLAGEFEAVSVSRRQCRFRMRRSRSSKRCPARSVRQAIRYRTRDSKSMFFLLNPGRTESVVRLPGADARRDRTALDPFTGTITQETSEDRDWTVPAVRGIFIIIEE